MFSKYLKIFNWRIYVCFKIRRIVGKRHPVQLKSCAGQMGLYY